jgi:Nif11 domain
MSAEAFNQFRIRVLDDASLQEQLQDLADREQFVIRVLEIGRRLGFDLAEEDVRNAMSEGRRSWIERWLI